MVYLYKIETSLHRCFQWYKLRVGWLCFQSVQRKSGAVPVPENPAADCMELDINVSRFN